MISYLQAQNITRRIGDRVIFSNVTINIGRNDKLALIGINGSGKSSLLDIIAGIENPDEGTLTTMRELRISYLRQEPVLNESNSVIDELFSSDTKLTRIIREYEKSLLSGDNAVMQKMIQQMDDNKAWDYEVAARQILTKLNLTDLSAMISSLSGGERKRVALAKALVEEHDLLILDEPTNHLDVGMIEWLEEYLSDTVKTLIMVTHDRYFLDRICNGIYDISGGTVSKYEGNYSYYVVKRAEKTQADLSNAERARNIYRSELEWMRRMPRARRHKSRSRISSFMELKEAAMQPVAEKQVKISVDPSRMGNKILELQNISKTYGSKILISNFSYKFGKFEKAGIVGPNGSGKTTLFNIIAGETAPDNGNVVKGDTVKFGYYRQNGMSFDEDMTVIDAVNRIAEKVTLNNGSVVTSSQFLNHFLFPPDRQRTLIRKLSGGEKRRLYLLTVLMQNPNFLLLDEPTNDLDIITLNVLEDYLSDFRGCLLIASHDRYFLDKIAGHIFEYRDAGIIKDFPGNYTQLLDSREESSEKPVKAVTVKRSARSHAGRETPAETGKGLTWKEKRELETLESEIHDLGREKQAIESEISSGGLDREEIEAKSRRYGEIMNILNGKELRWLELNEN